MSVVNTYNKNGLWEFNSIIILKYDYNSDRYRNSNACMGQVNTGLKFTITYTASRNCSRPSEIVFPEKQPLPPCPFPLNCY